MGVLFCPGIKIFIMGRMIIKLKKGGIKRTTSIRITDSIEYFYWKALVLRITISTQFLKFAQ